MAGKPGHAAAPVADRRHDAAAQDRRSGRGWSLNWRGDALGALQSTERLLCSLFPTISGPCDAQDFSSGVERLPTGEYAIFLYDLVYDGVDLAKIAFGKIGELVEKSLERLDACSCPGDEGCFRCIANPRVDERVSKAATRQLLQAIADVLRNETPTVVQSERDWSVELQSTSRHVLRTMRRNGAGRCSILLELRRKAGGRSPMCLTIEHSLRERYPFPAIRGQRMTRLEEADLGPFQLDGETAERLAEDNIGVFIGGCRDWDWMMDKLNILADTRFPARWLVVLADQTAGGDGVSELGVET